MKKIIVTLLIAGILFGNINMTAYGASLTATVSGGTVTQGQEITVTFKISADENIGALAYKITYDPAILEYISGAAPESANGMVMFYDDYLAKKECAYTLKFKAVGVGKTTLEAQAVTICTENGDDFSISNTAGSVTVNAPVIASSDNKLSSLTVSGVKKDGQTTELKLTPEFSSEVTEYKLSLNSDYERLALSANANDAKATVKTTGTTLTQGDNLTTVTVIAENGQKKYYNIRTYKEEETTTEQKVGEDRKIVYKGVDRSVLDMTDETALPEGFELTTIDFNGGKLVAATDVGKQIKLVLVRNEETKEHNFYVYTGGDVKNEKSFIDFIQYNIVQRRYIMLPVEENFVFGGRLAVNNPDLEIQKIAVGDGDISAYKILETNRIYIVRAANWNGVIGYYYYDIDDGSMMPVFTNNNTYTEEEIENMVNELNEQKGKELTQQHNAFEERIKKRNILIYGMAVGIVVLSVWGATILILKMRKKGFGKGKKENK